MLGRDRHRHGDVDHLAAGDGDHLGLAQACPAPRAGVGGVVDDLVGGVSHLQGVALGAGLLAGAALAASGPGLLGVAFLGLALAFCRRVT